MKKCNIVAEIGWNHMGDMNLAKKMILAASESGVDYVKFQTWDVKYLRPGSWDTDGRKELYSQAQLSENQHQELKEFCDNIGVKFLTSVFNSEHIDMLRGIGCEEIKIASCEALNTDLIYNCIKNFKHLYISTGGLTQDELISVVNEFKSYSNKITLLHCVSLYPCSVEECNIERMSLLNVLYPSRAGYSDHTSGTLASYMAISKGASIVEKHFTIDNSLPGRDNLNACLPEQLKEICNFRDIHDHCRLNVKLDRQESESNFEEFRGRWS